MIAKNIWFGGIFWALTVVLSCSGVPTNNRNQGSGLDQRGSAANICLNGRCKTGFSRGSSGSQSQGSFGSLGDGWSSDSTIISDRSGFNAFGTSDRGNRLTSGIGSWGGSDSARKQATSFGRVNSRRGNANEDLESSLFAGSSGRDSFSSSFGDSWTNNNGGSFTSVGSSAQLKGFGESRASSRFGARKNRFGNTNSRNQRNRGN